MELFKYIGKGFYVCIVLPFLWLCRFVFFILKYCVKGLFAPIILLNDSIKDRKEKPNYTKEQKTALKKQAAIQKKQQEQIRKRQAEIRRKEVAIKRAEDKKQKAIQREIERKKREEERKIKAIQKAEEKKKRAERRKIEQARKKEERRLRAIQRAEEKKKQAEKRKLDQERRAEERKQRAIQKAEQKRIKAEERKRRKLARIERRKMRKEETKEQRKLRKAREKQERQERARLARQKKIEAIHEKQAKKEQELYEKEKAKLEARKKRDEARRSKGKKVKPQKEKKPKDDGIIKEKPPVQKPGFKGKLLAFWASIKNFPKNFKKKLANNSLSKSARNRRDMNRQALLIDFEGEETKRSDIKLIYEYEAKSPEGKFVKGHFEAFSKVEVHSFLLSEGYEVYKIHTNRWITLKYARTASNKRKFKNKDLIFFLTQLSTYLKAGITLSESLKILGRQFSSTKAYENIFKSINYELSIGESFSAALEKQGKAFPALLINMLKTAEMTGSLPEVLDDMAEYYTSMEESRRQFVTAMMYPTIVGIFAIAVITFILVYVVPQFVDIYDSMDGTEIPQFTKIVMAISDFLKENLVFVLIGVVVFVLAFYLTYKKNRFFRTIMQMAAMRLPAIGNSIIYSEVTTFTKTFGSLLSHNVPIIDCMDILNKITNNEIYKMLILDVITNLAKGGKISDSFEGQWAFPIPAYEMIVTGEKTGELAEMMSKVSVYYQDLQKNAVARIKTFIEPAVTIFLAAAVGVIVLSIVIPMFGMYQSVSEMG